MSFISIRTIIVFVVGMALSIFAMFKISFWLILILLPLVIVVSLWVMVYDLKKKVYDTVSSLTSQESIQEKSKEITALLPFWARPCADKAVAQYFEKQNQA